MVAMAVVERSEAEAADSASSSPPVAAATMATDLAHHHARQGTHRTHARSETTPVRSSAQLGVDGANSLAKHQLTPSRPQQQRRWQPRKEHVASTDTNSTRINNKSNTSASSSTSAITSRRRVDKAADEGSSVANRSGTSGVGSRRRKGGSNTGSPRGSTSATGAGGRSSSRAGARTGGGEGRVPGLQQRVVDHLVGGGFDEALLETVPPHTLNWVLKSLGEQGAAAAAEQLFHWMRVKGLATQHSFAKLCQAYGVARQPWKAFQVWRTVRRMPQAAVLSGPQAAVALVLCYRSTADHRGAQAALQALLDHRFPLNRYAFNAAIRVCADAAAADDALALLTRLRELAARERQGLPLWDQAGESDDPQQPRQSSGGGGDAAAAAAANSSDCGGGVRASGGSSELHTDCRSYSAALAAVAAQGQWNRATQLHRWMVEDGVQADAHLCTQLLSCYSAAGQAAAAQRLFDSMLLDGTPHPNRTHWNALLLAYAGARDPRGCAAAYARMMAEGVPPDAYSMQALLRAAFFTKQGLAAVRAVRREMQRHRVQLNRKLGTAMLCCLRHVRVPAAEGDPTAALLPGSQPRPSVRQQPQQQHQSQQHQLQQYDQQHHQSQQQQQQQQQYQQQQRPRVDERAECLAEAAAVFAEMRAQAAQQRSPLDLRAYNSLLLVQLAAADHEGVLSTFRELEGEESLRPDATTLGIVISTCQAEGWLDEAEQYQQLLEGSRLLGALQGDEYEGSYHRSYHQRRA